MKWFQEFVRFEPRGTAGTALASETGQRRTADYKNEMIYHDEEVMTYIYPIELMHNAATVYEEKQRISNELKTEKEQLSAKVTTLTEKSTQGKERDEDTKSIDQEL